MPTMTTACGIIPHAIAARVPVLLLGAPGVGKTAALQQLARSARWTDACGITHCGVPMWAINLAHRDPSDILGRQVTVETPDGPAMGWLPPVEAVAMRRRDDGIGRPGILFLDELANAPRLVRACALKLLDHDRMFGAVAIAPEIGIVLASNRAADRALADRLDSATLNRCLVLDVEPDYDGWLDWATGQAMTSAPWEYPMDPIPATPVDPSIIGWVAWRRREGGEQGGPEDVLRAFDPRADDGKPFASPRSIDLFSRMLRSGLLEQHIPIVAEGLLGRQAPSYVAYRAILSKLPDPQAILADPDGAELPAELQFRFALAAALPAHVTPATAPAFWRLLPRLGAGARECEALAALLAYRMHGAAILQSPEFVRWWSDPRNQMIVRRDG